MNEWTVVSKKVNGKHIWHVRNEKCDDDEIASGLEEVKFHSRELAELLAKQLNGREDVCQKKS